MSRKYTANYRHWWLLVPVLAALLASSMAVAAQGPKPNSPGATLGTGFTYQGQLKKNGVPVNGTLYIVFSLYGVPSGGTPLYIIAQPVAVSNGLFTTQLDFGNWFNGDERYLGIALGADPELTPRQRLSAAPYALHALDGWSLAGNAGTAANDFVGTTDGMRLTLGVSGTAAMRIYPDAFSPNLIGGSQYNTLTVGLKGATIAGGGDTFLPNGIAGYFAVVGGGEGNVATGDYATVSGGTVNQATGIYAIAAGGAGNSANGLSTFAAGWGAVANQPGSFVWSDHSSGWPFYDGGANHFDVRATGGISLVTNVDNSGNPAAANLSIAAGNLVFGAQTRQMLNLWNQLYGIGVQNLVEYFRSDGGFAWFQKGVHSETSYGPGTGGTRLMKLDDSGNLHVLGTVNGGGADLAERIVTGDALQPGDVVEIDPEHAGLFRLAASANSSAVAGVVSTHPGVSMNMGDDGTDARGVQLALAGRVPVKVSAENGAIRPGDLLVAAATPGHAMRAPVSPAPGTILGKALGKLDDGTGLIDMLVMLR